MKILDFNDEKFEAVKIIKTDTDIIGQDSSGNEIFAFKGISDFSQFTLEEGQEFDTTESTLAESNRADIDYIMLMQGL